MKCSEERNLIEPWARPIIIVLRLSSIFTLNLPVDSHKWASRVQRFRRWGWRRRRWSCSCRSCCCCGSCPSFISNPKVTLQHLPPAILPSVWIVVPVLEPKPLFFCGWLWRGLSHALIRLKIAVGGQLCQVSLQSCSHLPNFGRLWSELIKKDELTILFETNITRLQSECWENLQISATKVSWEILIFHERGVKLAWSGFDRENLSHMGGSIKHWMILLAREYWGDHTLTLTHGVMPCCAYVHYTCAPIHMLVCVYTIQGCACQGCSFATATNQSQVVSPIASLPHACMYIGQFCTSVQLYMINKLI